MRVLHLIDSGTWDSAGTPWRPADLELCACRVLIQHAPVEQYTVLLGPAAARTRAERLGVTPDLVISPPLGRPKLAWRPLRRIAGMLRPDVVHCWNPGAARAAGAAFGSARIHAGCDGLPPPVDATPRDAAHRIEGRSLLHAMGIEGDVPVLALLGRADAADAIRFLYVLGSLQYAGVDVVGAVPVWARHIPRALRFAQRFGCRIRFAVFDAPWCEVLGGVDLAFWAGPLQGDGGVPAAWFIAEAHAMGVPVVASRSAGITRLYPAGAAGICLAANATPPELARIAMPLIEDAALRHSTSSAVRGHMASLPSARELVARIVGLWQGRQAEPPSAAAAWNRPSKHRESAA